MTNAHPVPLNPHLPDEGLAVPEDAQARAGQTPPAESGVSCLDAPEREALRRGWGPVPLTIIMIVVAVFLAGFIGRAVVLLI
ncbi:DUF6480 family protein [Streptomyces cocklensis]|jgi:hypothetical protein|uniref:Uncharacterized protein n=1 Tax=Actinacidiphila cocklensis TaxID=887465 RepID=A0A9W4DHX6_9ACTN|nr:DUF6480 family protein [Actinacidiphila cocklensis]MDD1058403.1 DUF6480 family protein [Actinacidiphila cocklensis]WSX75387.1 DUF6480 family protein [Streptomyces sp. NBC_00899]CAG6390545.1 conserved hypothetical protein [Actinacidiphila cocklensis]